MNLHKNNADFKALIAFAAQELNIIPAFVEKDYWITLVLNRLANSNHAKDVVFKGGTSLSKGYKMIHRFSEDVDIAIIGKELSGNAIKTKIRQIEKYITSEMVEIENEGITSKGSMFRKTIFEYPTLLLGKIDSVIPNRMMVEINSFANPYPFEEQEINSFISEFLTKTNHYETIEKYHLQPFLLQVLDKKRTLIEKLVSLLRFSFSENPKRALASKIRHFYDIYYLANDKECAFYIQSPEFKNDILTLWEADKQLFDTPTNWQNKQISDSPLIIDFGMLWNSLRDVYKSELSKLAFVAIPQENEIERVFKSCLIGMFNK